MRVVSTFHPSSSVSRSLKCCLTPDTSLEHLVVAKTDRLEVYSLRPDGLKLECTAEAWGNVVGLRSIPAKEEGRSHVLMMTDHPDPKLVVMEYDFEDEVVSLAPTSSLSLADRPTRPAEFVTDVQVDPTGKIAVASCFTGKLKVVPLKDGELAQPLDVSLPELNLLAFTFLHTGKAGRYTLALLHLNHRQQTQLLCRDVDLEQHELSTAHSNLILTTVLPDRQFPSLEPPPLLVSLPPYVNEDQDGEQDPELAGHRGGVLVLGGRKLMFFENSTTARQKSRREKQERLSDRLKSDKKDEVANARKKEEERESKKIKPRASVKWPWSSITAWCSVDPDRRRLLFGDVYGRLSMLVFDDNKMCMTLLPLGEASPPTCLTYLSSQVLYLGSHFGDSQLLRIHPSPVANASQDTLEIPRGITTVPASALASSSKGKGKAYAVEDDLDANGRIVNAKGTFLEVLHKYDNIAPLRDAVLADIDGSGQPQVITCSGGCNTGSLRVIRSEADFKEQARLQGLPGLTDVWPVKSNSGDSLHSHLVVSTLRETLVFSVNEKDAVSHLDPSVAGFVTDTPTFALSNIPRRETIMNGGKSTSSYVASSLVVQVTSQGVHLVEYDPTLGAFSQVGGWLPRTLGGDYAHHEVVAAALNSSQFIVGLSGGRLAVLNLGANDTLQLLKARDFTNEICAISCRPFDPSKNYTSTIAVSFWGSNKVALLALDTSEALSTVCETTYPVLPRSLLLHNFGLSARSGDPDFRPHLLAGLADGSLVTHLFRDKELHDRKQTSLGNAPVSLSVCDIDERTMVFASGARASVLFWDRQRIRLSPVSIKDMVRGVTFNAYPFPNCLAIATSSALLIGNVRGVDKMQIRTINLGLDNPRKVSYHAGQGLICAACTRTSPTRVGDEEETSGSVKLLDVHSFQQLDTFLCAAKEEPSAILSLPGPGSGTTPTFCVGTTFMLPGEYEPSRGRILLFSIVSPDSPQASGTRSLSTLVSEEVHGCVYALDRISDDHIVAAINTSVVLFRIIRSGASDLTGMKLEKVDEWNHNHFVTNLVYDGTYIVVGDAISSVSMVKWNEAKEKLESVARDYGPLWPVSIESTGNGVIGANTDCNLFSFSLQQTHGRNVLEKDGVYHIGDQVNKFLPGGLSSADISEDSVVKPTHVFFTSTGRIGAILEMASGVSLHMTALQRNMAKGIEGPGGVNHTQLRAPANPRGHSDAEPAFGFLDGDFLESFLNHPNAEELMEGEIEVERVTLPISTVKEVLVQMQSLH